MPVSKQPAVGRPDWITLHPEGKRCSYDVGSWAREFVNLSRIKTFTMDFHCHKGERPNFKAWIEAVVIGT